MMISLHPYTLFGTLEALIIVLVLAVVAFSKWRGERRHAEALRQELHQARTEVKREVVERVVETSEPQRGYGDFLREQLEQSSVLLGENTQLQSKSGQQEDPDFLARQMLAARHQFLQLEMDVQKQSASRDVEAQRRSVIEGMQALLAGLAVNGEAADRVAEAVDDQVIEDAATDEPAPVRRSEEDKLREQINYLRAVIGNQHDVMRELRGLLEEHGGDSEELHEALRKLGDAEAQGIELGRCLEVMEQENERLKQAVRQQGDGRSAIANPDADMLRDLVGSQQRTISKLQHMLQALAPDSGKASELADAINKIQRANNELNSCVMVLEDENTMLRGQVESLQERIADLEGHTLQQTTDTPTDDPEADTIAADEDTNVGVPIQEMPDGEVEFDVDALMDAVAGTDTDTTDTSVMHDESAGLDTSENEQLAADEDDLGEASGRPVTAVASEAAGEPISDQTPSITSTPSPAENEPEHEDIDSLLADLFADSNQAGSGSKS